MWLYAIATRHCLQQLRNRTPRELKGALLRADAPRPDAASDLAVRADLEATLAGLSPSDQELAVYFFRDGLTQEEISAVIRTSRKTVGKRLRRLAEQLSLALRDLEPAPSLAVGRLPTGSKK
jgi:RNA polymerase sigma factor (sigma-70 family)